MSNTTDHKHTPGPWVYSSGAVWADADEKVGVATRCSSSPIPPVERDANMRLIASAPDLLRERDELQVQVDTFRKSHSDALEAYRHADAESNRQRSQIASLMSDNTTLRAECERLRDALRELIDGAEDRCAPNTKYVLAKELDAARAALARAEGGK